MTQNNLYSKLLKQKIEAVKERIKKEDFDFEDKKTIKKIVDLLIYKKQRPSREEATVYIGILEQEYPLFMASYTNQEVIRLAREELGVTLHEDLIRMIRRPQRVVEKTHKQIHIIR